MAITYVPGYVPGGSSAKVGRAITSLAARMAPPKLYPGAFGVPNPVVTTVNQNMPTTPVGAYIGTLPSGYVPGAPTPKAPGSDSGAGSGAGSGSVDDYLASLSNDPMYQAATGAYTSATGNARDALTALIRNAVIRSGYDIRSNLPSDLASFGGDITDAVAQEALQNPFSQAATAQRAADLAQSDLGYSLAARGGLRSGALGLGTSAILQNQQGQNYIDTQNLLDALRGGVGTYQGALATALANRNAGYEAVASRLAQLAAARLGAGDTTTGTDTTTTDTTPPTTPPPAAPPSALGPAPLSWGGQTFTSKAAFNAWAKAHGTTAAREFAKNLGARVLYEGLR